MTTADQLREIVRFLQDRVRLAPGDAIAIAFEVPDADEMVAAGLDERAARALVAAPWWNEMTDDVVETPEYAEPDETAEVVLGYAKDVIVEYIGKRFELHAQSGDLG